MEDKEPIQGTIQVKQIGRTYLIPIGGFQFRIDLNPIRSEMGLHPLDIFQSDLERLLAIVSHLERFTPEQAGTEKRYTLEEVTGIPPKNDAGTPGGG